MGILLILLIPFGKVEQVFLMIEPPLHKILTSVFKLEH